MKYHVELSEGRERVTTPFTGDSAAGDARDNFKHARAALMAGQCLALIAESESGALVTLERVRLDPSMTAH